MSPDCLPNVWNTYTFGTDSLEGLRRGNIDMHPDNSAEALLECVPSLGMALESVLKHHRETKLSFFKPIASGYNFWNQRISELESILETS